MKKIGFILSILIVSFGAKSQIGHFPPHEQLLNEFLAFKKNIESYESKIIQVKGIDSLLADFELIWWADLETIDQYGIMKYPLNKSSYSRYLKSVMYGANYLMVDILEPPTGSLHDEVLYFKRKYVHSINDLKSDTIFHTFLQMHEIRFVEDSIPKPIINHIEDDSEYLKFESDYQIHDTVLLSNKVKNTNGMTFKLLYAVENRYVSSPIRLSGSSGIIYKGNQLNIRISDLSDLTTTMFYESTDSKKSELFKYKDYYILKASWKHIGNSTYYYDHTYYLELTSPHQVKYIYEMFNDSLEQCNRNPFYDFSLPSSKFLPPLKDSLTIYNGVIDSTFQYEIISYSYKNMFQSPTKQAVYTNCDFYGNGNYMPLKLIVEDVIHQYPDLKSTSYNQGAFITIFDAFENIGNSSYGNLIVYYLRRVD